MPPELRDPGDPAEWLRRARSNLAKARAGDAPEVVYEDLCFDAQQASEKAIKALLVRQQVGFPKTHAIGELLSVIRHNPTPFRWNGFGNRFVRPFGGVTPALSAVSLFKQSR